MKARGRVRKEPAESGHAERYDPALVGLLMVAVPLWMDRFHHLSWEERMTIRDECLGVIGVGKDDKDCMEGTACLAAGARGKPGQVAGAFNAIAKALALGALQPSGVTAFGLHFEVGEVPR